MRPRTGPCEHVTGSVVCGSTEDVDRFLGGLRCAAHTPGALAGRAPLADPAAHVYAAARDRGPGKTYGKATTDPLGRTGTGNPPRRLEPDPRPEDAPWLRENRTP